MGNKMIWILDARWGKNGYWTAVYKTDTLSKAQKAQAFLQLGQPIYTEYRIREVKP
jgi:hypothetical protein